MADPRKLSVVRFSQDGRALLVGHARGLKLYSTKKVDERLDKPSSYRFNDRLNLAVAQGLFDTKLVVYATNARLPQFNVVGMGKQAGLIWTKSSRTAIQNIKMNRKFILISYTNEIQVYAINSTDALYTITDVPPNHDGVMDLAEDDDRCLVAYPGSADRGDVSLFDPHTLVPAGKVEAHNGLLAALKFNVDGKLLATASTKGTVIRVFSTVENYLVYEFRRGHWQVAISCLSFSRHSEFLALSSDSDTVHVFHLSEENKRAVASRPHRNVRAVADGEATQGWGDAVTGVVMSVMPTPVVNYMTEDRSCAWLKVPGTPKKIDVAMTYAPNGGHRVLVATTDGFLYGYDVMPDGGECNLFRQYEIGRRAAAAAEDDLLADFEIVLDAEGLEGDQAVANAQPAQKEVVEKGRNDEPQASGSLDDTPFSNDREEEEENVPILQQARPETVGMLFGRAFALRNHNFPPNGNVPAAGLGGQQGGERNNDPQDGHRENAAEAKAETSGSVEGTKEEEGAKEEEVDKKGEAPQDDHKENVPEAKLKTSGSVEGAKGEDKKKEAPQGVHKMNVPMVRQETVGMLLGRAFGLRNYHYPPAAIAPAGGNQQGEKRNNGSQYGNNLEAILREAALLRVAVAHRETSVEAKEEEGAKGEELVEKDEDAGEENVPEVRPVAVEGAQEVEGAKEEERDEKVEVPLDDHKENIPQSKAETAGSVEGAKKVKKDEAPLDADKENVPKSKAETVASVEGAKEEVDKKDKAPLDADKENAPESKPKGDAIAASRNPLSPTENQALDDVMKRLCINDEDRITE